MAAPAVAQPPQDPNARLGSLPRRADRPRSKGRGSFLVWRELRSCFADRAVWFGDRRRNAYPCQSDVHRLAAFLHRREGRLLTVGPCRFGDRFPNACSAPSPFVPPLSVRLLEVRRDRLENSIQGTTQSGRTNNDCNAHNAADQGVLNRRYTGFVLQESN